MESTATEEFIIGNLWGGAVYHTDRNCPELTKVPPTEWTHVDARPKHLYRCVECR